MTQKSAKKTAARKRQATHGGKYQHHLRQVGGGGPVIKIIPKFDPSDPTSKTKSLWTGVTQDPIRIVEIVNRERAIAVWISPQPEGRGNWRSEIKHQTGPWPPTDKERAAFEAWLEDFAAKEWPNRTQLWPVIYLATSEAWGHRRGLSVGTRRVLQLLINFWQDASDAESDIEEHRAFGEPIGIIKQALSRSDATHEDVRRAIPVSTPYPAWGTQTLTQLADAERDGHEVRVIERDDGAIKWEILSREKQM